MPAITDDHLAPLPTSADLSTDPVTSLTPPPPCDPQPQNILLTGPFPGCDVKLCDFGISRLIEPGVEVREVLGTPDYVAPEVLQYEPISLRTDMW